MTDKATAIQTNDPGRKLPGRRTHFVESVQDLPCCAPLKDDNRPDIPADDSDTPASVEALKSALFGENDTSKDRLIGTAA